MEVSVKSGSLRIALPVGQTVLSAILMLGAVIGLGELIVRSEPARAMLLPPTVSGHGQLGAKLDQLEHLAASGVTIDCLFIGDSTVQAGIDPEVFGQAYATETGQTITCYNFGLVGITATGIERLTRIVAASYHPALIVYGANFQDLGDGGFDGDIPWVRFQEGDPSVEGWLEVTLSTYRYYLTYQNQVQRVEALQLKQSLSPYGFSTKTRIVDVSTPIVEGNFYDHLMAYQVSERQSEDLMALLALKRSGIRFAIVEMPTPDTTRAVAEQGAADYQVFLDRIAAAAQASQSPIWLTSDQGLVPSDGWQDNMHLNQTGALAFSTWLGRMVGEAARQGQLGP